MEIFEKISDHILFSSKIRLYLSWRGGTLWLLLLLLVHTHFYHVCYCYAVHPIILKFRQTFLLLLIILLQLLSYPLLNRNGWLLRIVFEVEG